MLSGYNVPANVSPVLSSFFFTSTSSRHISFSLIVCRRTYSVMEMYSTSRSEKYFKDPLEMKPERWLRGNKDENEGSKDENLAFSNLQFGFGTRMCLGEKDQLVKA